jgi:acetylornithine deacetylase
VSLLEVFCRCQKKNLPYTLILLISAEEEVSGKGGIESVLPLLPPIDVAIVGEPTGMQPAIAEKGLMVLDITAHGKAGHAARNEGNNAIDLAIEDIEAIRRLPAQLKSSPLLGPVKMTTTVIHAGSQHNVIPDECTFTVDVRSNELYDNKALFDIVSSHINSEAKARSFRLSSSSIEETHPLVQKLLKMGKKPYGSPTLSDQALMRFPSLKMGPGESSRSHTADEFIKLSEIEDAIATYQSILLD